MEIIPTQKIVNRDGIKAVKNGQKANQYSSIPNQKKPEWIRVKATFDKNFKAVKKQVQDKRLNTVCEEAMCPNISECWSAGTATFMLMGSVCTRACKFCSVDTGNPKGWLDLDEPMHTAQAVKTMGLKYVVLTSVNRDDLEDGGAEHYAQTVKAIKELNPETAVEALTPDFKGLASSIETLVNCGLEVFAQNVETVRRLTHPVRDIRAGYEQTLEVLAESKRINPKVLT
ncbi:MAG: lipoyl synthase, partial [SAR86 cluster bacterium BACL1 MAG-120828-bin5]